MKHHDEPFLHSANLVESTSSTELSQGLGKMRVKVKLVQNLMSLGLGYHSTAGAAGRLVASWYYCPRLRPLNIVRPEIGPMSFFFF
ncbi:hypothetical protein PVL29_013790 [Vitis rotundifolia]|uniref:Uncharacterized protein n=1 Tax=Vitis rotundifolia TaxID=103349 RepID=A0AA38ZMJ1_VITRO|nr:hypothetical protein PVL29_013790 [Vitis rotundifolia]